MKRLPSVLRHKERSEGHSPNSQTLVRGLDVLEMVATGPMPLPTLADRLGLARSTAHRLATALLERRYLSLTPREGYVLGPKLLELGALAQEHTDLVRVARAHMETLAADSRDTIHLTICESGAALLLERIAGHRRLLPSLRVGERTKLTQCAAGRALLFDQSEAAWRTAFAQDCGTDCPAAKSGDLPAPFIASMQEAAALGYAFDGEDALRTVAAPIRDADGSVVAALGLSSAALYLAGGGLAASGQAVRAVAAAISADLGHAPHAHVGDHPRGRGLAHGNLRLEGTIAGQESVAPLEARVPRVHDRKVNGSAQAGEPDLGVA